MIRFQDHHHGFFAILPTLCKPKDLKNPSRTVPFVNQSLTPSTAQALSLVGNCTKFQIPHQPDIYTSVPPIFLLLLPAHFVSSRIQQFLKKIDTHFHMSNDIISQYFKKGAEVEISSNDLGFRGSWYAGTVVRAPQNDKSEKVLVEYKTLMKSESSTKRLREEVDLVQLRPTSPPEKRLKFKFSEEVDAWYSDGWWEGIVTELLGDDKYAVFFRGTKEQLHFRARELRLHREWVYGKWVPPLVQQASDDQPPQCNQMQNDSLPAENFEHNFSPGTLVEVHSCDEGFEGAWFSGTVVKNLNNEKYLIEYQNIYDDKDDTKLLREEVDSRQLRPHPPDIGIVDRFEVHEQVEAMYDGVWWVGVISQVRKNNRYSVFFKAADEILSFKQSDLRVHQEWINGKWVIAPKVLEL